MVADATGGIEDSASPADEFQQRFGLLADLSSDGICVHQNGRIVFANAAAVRWMGADDRAGLIGRRVEEFVHPESMPDVERRLARLRREGDSSPASEVVMRRPSNTARDVQTTSMRLDWNGRPAVVTHFRDLTTVKAAATLKYQAALIKHVSDAVVSTSATGIVTTWNPAAELIYQRAAGDVLGIPLRDAVGAPLDPADVVGGGGIVHTTHRAADGSALSVRVSAAAMDDGYVLVCADLTALRRVERHFEAVVSALDVGVIVFNADGWLETVNPAARRLWAGLPSGAEPFAADIPLLDVDGTHLADDRRPLRLAAEEGAHQIDQVVGVDRTDGQRQWFSVSNRPLDADRTGRRAVLCTFVDVTAQRQAQDELAHAALHDGLTGLPNRSNALTQIARSLEPGSPRPVSAVLFVDLDDMKGVNDSYGHGAGDAVLSATAHRMREALREGDVIARLAGDEFVVVMFGHVDRAGVDRLVADLHRAVAQPTEYGNALFHVSASIGITLVEPGDRRTAAEILASADGAMYAAKASGPGRSVYSR